jgi:hypothetical protein
MNKNPLESYDRNDPSHHIAAAPFFEVSVKTVDIKADPQSPGGYLSQRFDTLPQAMLAVLDQQFTHTSSWWANREKSPIYLASLEISCWPSGRKLQVGLEDEPSWADTGETYFRLGFISQLSVAQLDELTNIKGSGVRVLTADNGCFIELAKLWEFGRRELDLANIGKLSTHLQEEIARHLKHAPHPRVIASPPDGGHRQLKH